MEKIWTFAMNLPDPHASRSATRLLRLECDWRCNLSCRSETGLARMKRRLFTKTVMDETFCVNYIAEYMKSMKSRDAGKSPEAMKQPCNLLIMGCLWDSCKPMSSATCQGLCSADNAPWMYLYFQKKHSQQFKWERRHFWEFGSYDTDILNSYPKLPLTQLPNISFLACWLILFHAPDPLEIGLEPCQSTKLRKVAADDHELFMQQQTRNAEAYARKIKDVWLWRRILLRKREFKNVKNL